MENIQQDLQFQQTTSHPDSQSYLGIKRTLDNNKVNCMKRTIIQASDLKEKIDSLGIITNNNSTMLSVDAEAYYPSSIHFSLVRKAVHCYSQNLEEEDQLKI